MTAAVELVSPKDRRIGTDTGFAGCRWVERTVYCEKRTERVARGNTAVPEYGYVGAWGSREVVI